MDTQELLRHADKMREALESYWFTSDEVSGDDMNNEDVIEACKEYDEFIKQQPGAWVVWVYGDAGPQCLFLHSEEIEAHRYVQQLGYPANVKFWIFGEEFGTR